MSSLVEQAPVALAIGLLRVQEAHGRHVVFVDFLVALHRLGASWHWLLLQLVLWWCRAAECVHSKWPTDVLSHAPVRGGERLDPGLVHAVGTTLVESGVVQSAYKVGKFAKAVGRALPNHTCEADLCGAFRYWQASRREMQGSKHYALSTDASRVAGKDRYMTCFMNLATKVSCWGPPMVIPGLAKTCFFASTGFRAGPGRQARQAAAWSAK